MITKIEMKDVESRIGVLPTVSWSGPYHHEGPDGELVISGVNTYDQLTQVLELLRGGGLVVPEAEALAYDDAMATETPLQISEPDIEPEQVGDVSEDIVDAPVEAVAEEVVAEEAPVEPDYTEVYARLTRLADLVKLLRDIGYNDFNSIYAKALDIQAAGVCPMLMRVDNLEKRLKTTCAALQVPMAA